MTEKNETHPRDDHQRLRELIHLCEPLKTCNVPVLCDQAMRTWSYARSVAHEIGEPFDG